MLPSIRRGFAALLLVAPLVAFVPMHDHLVKAIPAVGAIGIAAPKSLELFFNEPPSVALTKIILRSATDSMMVMPLEAPRRGGDPKSVAVRIRPALHSGVYTVIYRTAGPDGHVIRGQYQFGVK